MSFQFQAGFQHGFLQPLEIAAFRKVTGRLIMQPVPELLLYFSMNTFITNNGEVLLFKINMKQHGIQFGRLVPAQFRKNLKSNFRIISFSVGINMNPDFAGRIIFCRLNGFYQLCQL